MTIQRNRLLAAATLCILSTLTTAGAVAQPAYEFNLPQQSLADALRAIGQQTTMNILFEPESVENLTAPAVRGYLSPEEAIKRVLVGTKLVVEQAAANSLLIAPVGSRLTSNSAKASTLADITEVQPTAIRLAQSETPETTNNQAAQKSDASSDESDNKGIQEITVTAQRRAESLKDVPISISVVTGADLDRSTSQGLTEALNRVPGVTTAVYGIQGGGTIVGIRGVTPSGPVFNGSSPIGYYLDSVPFGLAKSAIAPDANAYDMERVEVLRGPQGTLYGANALNGVVRVLTRNPDLDDFELKMRGSTSSTTHGNWGYRGDAAINVPIVEGKLAVRGVVGYQDLGGWIDIPVKKNTNDTEISNIRLKVEAAPVDDLSIGLSAWRSRADLGGPSVSDGNYRRNVLREEPSYTDFDTYSLKLEYEFAWAQLTSATSYLDYRSGGNATALGSDTIYQYTDFDSQVFSEEVTLNSVSEGHWRWSIGGIYRDAEDRLASGIPALIPVFLDESDLSKSFAAFGEITRLLADGRFELTAGLRYFEDDVTHRENQRHFGAPTPDLTSRDQHFDAVTPRLVATWHPSQAWTLYGSYAEGFRSGFDQYASVATAASFLPPAKPDTLKNYELGSKANLLNGRMELETAVYYVDWQDVQQSILVELAPDLQVTSAVNGDSASGMGIDFGMTTRPLDGLELSVNLNWNDLTMDKALISGGSALFDAGDRLNLSAEYTAGASAAYGVPMGGSGLKGEFSVSGNYTSNVEFRTIPGVGAARLTGISDDMLIARAAFAVQSPAHWTVTLFADNITNEYRAALVGPFSPEADSIMRVRPRTVGLQFEYQFAN